MKKIAIIALSIALCLAKIAEAGELMLNPEKIISMQDMKIPQAPRVSPDGRQLVFEYYLKGKVSLWHATSDGKNVHCLTCDGPLAGMNIENGYWHPSGHYLVFNRIPEKEKNILQEIYTAKIENGRIVQPALVDNGARPQFSHPYGHVIFFEKTQYMEGLTKNILAYRILGADPLHPAGMAIELRGPIQKINRTAEVSHPSLAPDGTTIVFAARTTSIGTGGQENIVLTDIDRQKIYQLWGKLIKINKEKINDELASFATPLRDIRGGKYAPEYVPAIGKQLKFPRSDFQYLLNQAEFLSRQSIVPGFTKRHLLLAWTLGLLDALDPKYDDAVQEMIYSRLWITDVFGSPIIPLVKEGSSTALPQKWPTVSQDGRFVVFEAGLYTNRHIYLIAKNKVSWLDKAIKYVGIDRAKEWQEKAIKITELGTYNSSPELDPTGQWLYFESNRDGTKGIWRAKLNWPEINKRLGL